MLPVIVFDLGQVLLPFSYSGMYKKMDSLEDGLGDRFKAWYKENYFYHRRLERGDMPEQEFLHAMLAFLDFRMDAEEFCRYYSEIFTPDEQVVSLLPKLHSKGYRLLLLSNTSGIHQRYGWQQYTFTEIFEKKFLSHEVNALKPEEKIYRAVMDYTGVVPGSHFFIDDIPEYTAAAAKLGWKTHTHTDYQSLTEALMAENIRFD